MNLWKVITQFFPSTMTLGLAILVFLIPWGFSFVSKKFHIAGDPPWKKDNKKE